MEMALNSLNVLNCTPTLLADSGVSSAVTEPYSGALSWLRARKEGPSRTCQMGPLGLRGRVWVCRWVFGWW